MRSLLVACLVRLAFCASGMINSGTPNGVPDEIDCAIRGIAWQYGRCAAGAKSLRTRQFCLRC
jgi:hypothetical protein